MLTTTQQTSRALGVATLGSLFVATSRPLGTREALVLTVGLMAVLSVVDRPAGRPAAGPAARGGVTTVQCSSRRPCYRREIATPSRQIAPPTSPYTVGISDSSNHDSSTDTAGTAYVVAESRPASMRRRA